MSLWEAVLLGVVQGLTEFLPVSSTAHLLVVRQLLHHENPRDAGSPRTGPLHGTSHGTFER